MNESQDAAVALEAMRASRIRLIEAAETPPARHAAFAALMGVLVAAPVLPIVARFVVLGLALCAIPLIIQWDRRRTGMFINGYRRGKTRRVLAVVLAGWFVLYSLSTWLALDRHLVWPSLVLGLIGTVAGYFASKWWCAVFRREMLDA